MTITAYSVVAKKDPTAFAAAVTASIALSNQPFGAPFHDPITECLVQVMIAGSQVLVGSTGSTGAAGATGATLTNPPIVTTSARDLLTPAEGDVVYNSTTKKINFYNGTAWAAVTSV